MMKSLHFTVAKDGSGYAISAGIDGQPARLLRDGIAGPPAAKADLKAYMAGALLAGARVSSSEPPEVRKQP